MFWLLCNGNIIIYFEKNIFENPQKSCNMKLKSHSNNHIFTIILEKIFQYYHDNF